MKKFIMVIFIVFALSGCQKDNATTNNEANTIGASGSAVIEGRVGYFSAALPPPNSTNTFPYPSGYQLGENHWITSDTPKVASRIYIVGDYGQFKNKYVQIKGTWTEVIKIQGSEEYRYTEISVDSLQILQ